MPLIHPSLTLRSLGLGVLLASTFFMGCEKVEIRERYPEGSPKREDVYRSWGKHDSLHLIRLQSYFFNGHLDYVAEYRQGLRHGNFRDYWHNGQIKSEGRYQHGKRQGTWKFYWNRFQISSQGQYRDDRKQGKWSEYFENGERRRRGSYEQGDEIGTWEAFNIHNEKIWTSSCYRRNDTGSFHGFFPNGEKEEEYACRRGSPIGLYQKWLPTGDTVLVGNYDSLGRKQGLWRHYFEGQQVKSRQSFLNGLWHDTVIFYDSLGHRRQWGVFRQGTGQLETWDTLGHIVERMPYQANQREGEAIAYYPEGQVASRFIYAKDTLISMKRFHPNGKVALIGQYLKGKRDSLWVRFHPNGKTAETTHYSLGVMQGEQIFFDSIGEVTQKIRYEHGYPAEGKFKGVPGIGPKIKLN